MDSDEWACLRVAELRAKGEPARLQYYLRLPAASVNHLGCIVEVRAVRSNGRVERMVGMQVEKRLYRVINLNDKVRVKLTSFGRSVAEKSSAYQQGLPGCGRDGEWQLYELMNVFGPVMRMGATEVPFENNEIELLEVELEKEGR